MTATAADLAYRARALAQAHPLTATAAVMVERDVQEQRSTQPLAEFSLWAGTALLHGYCVRCVEEAETGVDGGGAGGDRAPTIDELDAMIARISADLRVGDPAPHLIGDRDRTFAALDRIVASEVERRLDHWRDRVDDEARIELGDYLAWWVTRGYALRVAEMAAVVAS